MKFSLGQILPSPTVTSTWPQLLPSSSSSHLNACHMSLNHQQQISPTQINVRPQVIGTTIIGIVIEPPSTHITIGEQVQISFPDLHSTLTVSGTMGNITSAPPGYVVFALHNCDIPFDYIAIPGEWTCFSLYDFLVFRYYRSLTERSPE